MRRLLNLGALSLCIALGIEAAAHASITGVETGDPVQFAANSTNALNYAKMTPGRVGQDAPYVLFDSAVPGSITLNFNNPANGLAFFEARIDGIVFTPDNSHPNPAVIAAGGDDIYGGAQGTSLSAYTTGVLKSFSATSMVEIRLALGGERDWDFNWTAFDVPPAVVPEPATVFVWSGITAIAGLAYLRKQRAA